jgi:hypothetical protein
LAAPSKDGSVIEFFVKNEGAGYSGRKADLAAKVCKDLDKAMLCGCMALETQITMMCEKIRVWNAPERAAPVTARAYPISVRADW